MINACTAMDDSVAKSTEGRGLAELRRFLRGDAEKLADEFYWGEHHKMFGAKGRGEVPKGKKAREMRGFKKCKTLV